MRTHCCCLVMESTWCNQLWFPEGWCHLSTIGSTGLCYGTLGLSSRWKSMLLSLWEAFTSAVLGWIVCMPPNSYAKALTPSSYTWECGQDYSKVVSWLLKIIKVRPWFSRISGIIRKDTRVRTLFPLILVFPGSKNTSNNFLRHPACDILLRQPKWPAVMVTYFLSPFSTDRTCCGRD
jgi:hypothetical protein